MHHTHYFSQFGRGCFEEFAIFFKLQIATAYPMDDAKPLDTPLPGIAHYRI